MAVFDNLGGGEDISAIIDAIEGMGVDVPEGASSDDVAEIIRNQLEKRVAVGSYISANSGEAALIYGSATTITCPFSSSSSYGDAFVINGNVVEVKKRCTVTIYAALSTMHKHYNSSGTVYMIANINGSQRTIWHKSIDADNQSGSGQIENVSLNVGDKIYFQVLTNAPLQIYGFTGKITVTA